MAATVRTFTCIYNVFGFVRNDNPKKSHHFSYLIKLFDVTDMLEAPEWKMRFALPIYQMLLEENEQRKSLGEKPIEGVELHNIEVTLHELLLQYENRSGYEDDEREHRQAPIAINAFENTEVVEDKELIQQLYAHRNQLFVALANHRPAAWKSKVQSDGEDCEHGWFLAGIGKTPGEQITYLLPINLWDELQNAQALDHAPTFDGHNSDDVLERLKTL